MQSIRASVTIGLAAILTFLSPAESAAAVRDGVQVLSDTTAPEIMSINGIKTDPAGAVANSQELARMLDAADFPVANYHVSYFYNPNAPEWRLRNTSVIAGIPLEFVDDRSGDLLEVALQMSLSRFALDSANGDRNTYYKNLGDRYNENARRLADLSELDRRVYGTALDLKRRLINRLTVLNRRYIVIVPHSQGNYFAEAAYAMLYADGLNDLLDRVRIVGVAVPSARTPNDRYLTQAGDSIISGARTLATARGSSGASPLPSNIDATVFPSVYPAFGHGFVPIYLNENSITFGGVRLPTAIFGLIADSVLELNRGTNGGLPLIAAAPTCTSPVVGQVMTCTVSGLRIPETTTMSATNCEPSAMSSVANGATSQRSFACTPVTAGSVAVSYQVPGLVAGLPPVAPLYAVLPAGAALARTTLLSPIDGVEVATRIPTFRWSGGTANYWQLNIRLAGSSTIAVTAIVPATQFSYTLSPSQALVSGAAYRWDISACTDNGCAANFVVSADGLFSTPPFVVPPVVTGVACTPPVVGQTLLCTVNGSSLPPTGIALTATNCSPNSMLQQPGGSSTSQVFACSPVAAGSLAISGLAVPGLGAVSINLPVYTVAATQPTSVQVSGLTCDTPIASTSMTCTIGGSNLPAGTTMTAVNCLPSAMAVVGVADSASRRYGCTPIAAGLPVRVTAVVPGYASQLPSVPVRTTQFSSTVLAGSSVRFADSFVRDAVNTLSWSTVAGSPTQVRGMLNLPANSEINTNGRFSVAGETLIVEARFAGPSASTPTSGRNTWLALVDASSGDYIRIGDSDAGGIGMFRVGTGSFGLPVAGNGVSTQSFKEYRLLISGSSIVVERGDTLAGPTERMTAVLGASISGRQFYLQLGTGDAAHSPGLFDWIVVKTPRATGSTPRQIFASGLSGQFMSIDASQQSSRTIGTLSQPVLDIAFAPLGELYGVVSTVSYIYRIDPQTAGMTLVANSGLVANVNALAFSPDGTLYGVERRYLYEMDPILGSPKAYLGEMGYDSAGDLEFDSSGRMYMTTTTGQLVHVNRYTAGATLIGRIGFNVLGLAFDGVDNMYGFSSGSEVLLIDRTTGGGTALFTVPASGGFAGATSQQ